MKSKCDDTAPRSTYNGRSSSGKIQHIMSPERANTASNIAKSYWEMVESSDLKLRDEHAVKLTQEGHTELQYCVDEKAAFGNPQTRKACE
ncbi:hypothetical protein CLCR_04464 [Cladophialophora carrionii]|uniref:Uncharacterized protein n=1 Tax=Cladophialophora carrionii TaxID=86049 RepID=A0A1C1CJ87_9EURO|nr:hypothetical protein CLCR_04464 [Cladophialophora carrionii]